MVNKDMYEPSHFYPQLVTEMIIELENSEYADTILVKYHSKAISEQILKKIYSVLNYPEVYHMPSGVVIQLIVKEYMSDFPPIDNDTEIYTYRNFFDMRLYNIYDEKNLSIDRNILKEHLRQHLYIILLIGKLLQCL